MLDHPAEGITTSIRTVGRHLLQQGLNRRRFLDPTGVRPARSPAAAGASTAIGFVRRARHHPLHPTPQR